MKKMLLINVLTLSVCGITAMQSPLEHLCTKGLPLANQLSQYMDPKTRDSLRAVNKQMSNNERMENTYYSSLQNKIEKITTLKNIDASEYALLSDRNRERLTSLYCNDDIKLQQLGVRTEIHDDNTVSFYKDDVELFKKINLSLMGIRNCNTIQEKIQNYPNQSLVFTHDHDFPPTMAKRLIDIIAKNNAYVPDYDDAHVLNITTNKTRVTFDISTLNNILLQIVQVEDIKKDNILLLLQHGADINAVDNLRMTPLHWATLEGYAETAELLIKNGAVIDTLDSGGRTPLSWASSREYDEIMELLISNNANINTTCNMGMSPLFYAILSSNINAVDFLIYNGADLDICDNDRRTALSWAVSNVFYDAIEVLVENGADITIADNNGLTPLDWANRGRDSRIISLLTSEISDSDSEFTDTSSESSDENGDLTSPGREVKKHYLNNY